MLLFLSCLGSCVFNSIFKIYIWNIANCPESFQNQTVLKIQQTEKNLSNSVSPQSSLKWLQLVCSLCNNRKLVIFISVRNSFQSFCVTRKKIITCQQSQKSKRSKQDLWEKSLWEILLSHLIYSFIFDL